MTLPLVERGIGPRTHSNQGNTAMKLHHIALALLAVGQAAHAASEQPAFYVGLSGGAAVVAPRDYDLKHKSNTDGSFSPGVFAGMRVATVPLGGGWPLYGEVGYQSVRRFEGTYATSQGDTRVETKGHSTFAAARLAWPLTPNFELFTRLGVSRNSAESRTVSGPNVIDVNGDKTSLLSGIGLEYRFDNGIGLRGDLTNYGKSSKNADTGALNFSVSYRF